ncbi:MAG TPA: biotin/lipoyl-binding protein, partial [Candidatus Angelobacter sp.]|nr:biotin/lipoyl-binding protein [Candidatus Angelobacter sp.]
MNKRMIIMLASIALFFVAIGSFKFLQIKAAIAQGASWQAPPEAVTTIVTSQEKWPSTLSVIGTVAAVHGVTVSADLPGIVEKISFDSGEHVQEGETLVSLDTRQERAQLKAAESQLQLSKLN